MIWVLDVEDMAYLLLGRSGGCGSQPKHSSLLPELLLDHFVQHQISWSEIVGPLRCTVNLIDADHRYFPSELVQILREETLWSDEEHLDVLLLDRNDYLLLCDVLLLRIEASAWQKVRQLIELIGHKRNQRSHDKDETRHELGCVLVDQRFASSSC